MPRSHFKFLILKLNDPINVAKQSHCDYQVHPPSTLLGASFIFSLPSSSTFILSNQKRTFTDSTHLSQSNSSCTPCSALSFAFRDESPILLSRTSHSTQTIIPPFFPLKLNATFFSSLSFCSPWAHSDQFMNMPLFLPSEKRSLLISLSSIAIALWSKVPWKNCSYLSFQPVSSHSL